MSVSPHPIPFHQARDAVSLVPLPSASKLWALNKCSFKKGVNLVERQHVKLGVSRPNSVGGQNPDGQRSLRVGAGRREGVSQGRFPGRGVRL